MTGRIAIFILGASALPLAQKIKTEIGGDIHGPEGLVGCDKHYEQAIQAIAHAWRMSHAVIGICASGILIRALGPLLKSKMREPVPRSRAEDCSSLVPRIAVHRGAYDLGRKIPALTNRHAAITTPSDVIF